LIPGYRTIFMKNDIHISLVKRKSAKEVVLDFFRDTHPRMKEENLLKLKTQFELTDPPKEDVTVAELLVAVRKLGIWGFCDHISPVKKEIHYWVGKNVSKEDTLNFIGHEVAHAAGYPEEEDAIRIGQVVELSYEIYEEDFKLTK